MDSKHRGRRNIQRKTLQVTIFILLVSIATAVKSPSSQPFVEDQQHLVVFQKLGMMFNPSFITEEMWENDTKLADSVMDWLNFKKQATIENTRAIRYLTIGILGTLGFLPIEPVREKKFGTLYRLVQLQPLPWLVNGVRMIPQNQKEEILAFPINDQSEPVQFSKDQMHLCKRMQYIYYCDIEKMKIKTTEDSCLIALVNKNYLAALDVCNFTISNHRELVYQIKPELYLLYSADHQHPVYKCTENTWSGLSIQAGISFVHLKPQCRLNLNHHFIKDQALTHIVPEIELLRISNVYKDQTKTPNFKPPTIIDVYWYLIFALCIVHCALCIAHCALCTVH